MKKIIFSFFIVLLVALLLIMAMFHNRKSNRPQISGPQVTVKGQKFSVEVVSTPEKLALGLGKRDSLCSSCGMLFRFGGKGIRSFWMKDMRFPLDIIWIADGKIVYIARNISFDYKGIISPDIGADEVLEINAGLCNKFNFAVGDEIKS